MSHFKRIKTKINDLTVLKKTLKELGYRYNHKEQYIKDLNDNTQLVNMVAEDNNKNLLGFLWDGNEYNIITDLQVWNKSFSFDFFFNKMLQQYALNSIMDTSSTEGFEQLSQETMKDGSVKLTVQRWN
uniref:Uncharacterized protein ycf35 n=1 Tax=Pterocladia lucida TaxID=31408 RepID=A0A6M3WVU9_PTELU|nr:Ycf35 [Pterocladia lucida]